MTQSIQRYLGAAGPLARLKEHAARLHRLQADLQRCLPPLLAASCSVANLKGDTLVIFAQSTAVAVKLKQMTPSLLQHLREQGHPLTDVHVKVSIRQPRPTRPPPIERRICAQGKQCLTAFAATLPADSPLREALERLARRSR